MVALSLDSVWSLWPWIPFGLALDDLRGLALGLLPDDLRGLALDDPGVNGCGGAVVVGLLLLDSVWRSLWSL